MDNTYALANHSFQESGEEKSCLSRALLAKSPLDDVPADLVNLLCNETYCRMGSSSTLHMLYIYIYISYFTVLLVGYLYARLMWQWPIT